MISSKKELMFYIASDRIMKGLPAQQSFKDKVLICIGLGRYASGGLIIEFQKRMRLLSYFQNKPNKSIFDRIQKIFNKICFDRLGEKLGISIYPDSFGYGLVIPHYGTIVVNGGCSIGNYCVLHTSTCIAGGGKSFGDGLYLSSGAKITGIGNFGDAVSIAANSVVKEPAPGHCLLAGMPAVIKRLNYPYWYERDGSRFLQRVALVEKLRKNTLE